MEDSTSEQYDEETKKCRAFLRERFLRLVAALTDKQESTITMLENTTVKAKLRAFDREFENIAVENLKTAFKPVEKAVLRSSDIITISTTFPNEEIEALNI